MEKIKKIETDNGIVDFKYDPTTGKTETAKEVAITKKVMEIVNRNIGKSQILYDVDAYDVDVDGNIYNRKRIKNIVLNPDAVAAYKAQFNDTEFLIDHYLKMQYEKVEPIEEDPKEGEEEIGK